MKFRYLSYRDLMIFGGILSLSVIAIGIWIFYSEVHTPKHAQSSFQVQEAMGESPKYTFSKDQEAELQQLLREEYRALFGNEFIKACQYERGYFGLLLSTEKERIPGYYNFHGLPKVYDSVEIYTSSFVGFMSRVILVYYENGRVSHIIEGEKNPTSKLGRHGPPEGFRCSGASDFPNVILQ